MEQVEYLTRCECSKHTAQQYEQYIHKAIEDAWTHCEMHITDSVGGTCAILKMDHKFGTLENISGDVLFQFANDDPDYGDNRFVVHNGCIVIDGSFEEPEHYTDPRKSDHPGAAQLGVS